MSFAIIRDFHIECGPTILKLPVLPHWYSMADLHICIIDCSTCAEWTTWICNKWKKLTTDTLHTILCNWTLLEEEISRLKIEINWMHGTAHSSKRLHNYQECLAITLYLGKTLRAQNILWMSRIVDQCNITSFQPFLCLPSLGGYIINSQWLFDTVNQRLDIGCHQYNM